MKVTKFSIYGIYPKQYSNEIAGGDSEIIISYNSKSKAFAKAKIESKKRKWFEVEVRAYDFDFELIGHWYFKNGKLTYNMSV